MFFLLGQIYVIAKDKDGGWIQLLVFVVMAAIWAIGGILKAKKLKGEQREEKAQPRRPKELFPRPEQRMVKVDEEKTTIRSVFIQKMLAGIERQMPAEVIKPVEAPIEVKRKPLKTTVKPILKRAEKEPIVEDLFKLDNPDDLRRAFIHYEIIGKPLSLRH